MVENSDIVDRPSLELWLQGQSPEVAVWIAARAAARILPALWDAVLSEAWAQEQRLTVLPSLRCVLIALVKAQNPLIDLSAANAADKALIGFQTPLELEASRIEPQYAAYASTYAARAASVEFSDLQRLRAYAADAADAASLINIAAWSRIKTEAKHANTIGIMTPCPLWRDGAGPLSELYSSVVWQIQQNFADNSEETNRPPPKEDWSFWIDWYQSLLDGKPMLGDAERTLEMLTEVALIKPEVWEKGPEVVNPLINEIWGAYKAKGLSHGERFRLDAPREVFVAEVAAPEKAETLEFCLEKLRGLDELVQQFGNLGGGLRGELFLIRHAVDKHGANAAMVWNNVRAARMMLPKSIASGVCPSAEIEPAVGIFETGLMEVETLLAQEPEVKDIRADMGASEVLDAPEAMKVLSLAGYEIAEVVDEATAADMREVLPMMDSPVESRAMRAWAASLTAGRVINVFLAARYANFQGLLDEAQTTSEKVKVITKNLAVIGASGGAAIGVVQAVLNSDKVAKAIEVIMTLF